MPSGDIVKCAEGTILPPVAPAVDAVSNRRENIITTQLCERRFGAHA